MERWRSTKKERHVHQPRESFGWRACCAALKRRARRCFRRIAQAWNALNTRACARFTHICNALGSMYLSASGRSRSLRCLNVATASTLSFRSKVCSSGEISMEPVGEYMTGD